MHTRGVIVGYLPLSRHLAHTYLLGEARELHLERVAQRVRRVSRDQQDLALLFRAVLFLEHRPHLVELARVLFQSRGNVLGIRLVRLLVLAVKRSKPLRRVRGSLCRALCTVLGELDRQRSRNGGFAHSTLSADKQEAEVLAANEIRHAAILGEGSKVAALCSARKRTDRAE